MTKDDILFLDIQLRDVTCILFVCDTYLYPKANDFYGKLMYTNKRVHGPYMQPRKKSSQILFNCAYRYTTDNILKPLTDEELQEIGKSLGLMQGLGLDKHLCGIPEGSKVVFLHAPSFLEYYSSDETQSLADEIGITYGVDPKDLRITGGLHLFHPSVAEAHDVDIVVPIDSLDQVRTVFNHVESRKNKPVVEFGYVWPLRWFSTDGHLVCPFFIYRNLTLPIERLTFTGQHYHSKVYITDDMYSIFNAPLLITEGGVGLVFCRSTLLRGMLRKNQIIHLNCPLYVVSQGSFVGEQVAVITNPFKEITNILEILNEYRT